ncbi:MAG: hypothetical protein K2I74_01425, partial [Treponemataceae bacterium]|nr:hypothetical protein [Treponemataceae bacterium]
HAKTNAQWRQQFMTWEQEMKEQVKERATEAFEEGAAQKAVETARKLLDEAIPMETVARCTGLPLAQVEQLRQEVAVVKA